jgi:hypothetical protein
MTESSLCDTEVAARLARIKFTFSRPKGDRIHHVVEDDIRVVLSRLPVDTWDRLRAVHFNDRSRGGRILGYVTSSSREIALCALPPRISFTRALAKGESIAAFGATRGKQWPGLAIRRFMLYDVFLHELGHLQLIDAKSRSDRLKFAREKLAQQFAMKWCQALWSEPFAHPDPVHNRASPLEIGTE